jgi:hypothetical protein
VHFRLITVPRTAAAAVTWAAELTALSADLSALGAPPPLS